MNTKNQIKKNIDEIRMSLAKMQQAMVDVRAQLDLFIIDLLDIKTRIERDAEKEFNEQKEADPGDQDDTYCLGISICGCSCDGCPAIGKEG